MLCGDDEPGAGSSLRNGGRVLVTEGSKLLGSWDGVQEGLLLLRTDGADVSGVRVVGGEVGVLVGWNVGEIVALGLTLGWLVGRVLVRPVGLVDGRMVGPGVILVSPACSHRIGE